MSPPVCGATVEAMAERTRPSWRSTAWLSAGAVLAVLAVIAATVGTSPEQHGAMLASFLGVAAITLAWALLRTRAQRREYEAQLTAWAARQGIVAERLRIARDLHDVVSHSLGLITLRTAGARRQLAAGIEVDHPTVLADIEDASRQATTELRRMLGLLRDEATPQSPLRPAARIDDLPGLVEEARRFGLDAGLRLGELGAVTAGVQLAVVAVVREGLANTARHAGPTRVRIDVDRDGDAITVGIRDFGASDHWTARPGAGHGLIGLRERAESLGGSLVAEPADPGFRLCARLPDPA